MFCPTNVANNQTGPCAGYRHWSPTARALGLTVHRREVGSAVANGNTLAHILLGIERGGFFDADKLAALLEHSPTKAQHITLAIVLGGIEDSTDKTTWRYPAAVKAQYFQQLATWGYGLSEVEQIVIDATTAEATAPDAVAPDEIETQLDSEATA